MKEARNYASGREASRGGKAPVPESAAPQRRERRDVGFRARRSRQTEVPLTAWISVGGAALDGAPDLDPDEARVLFHLVARQPHEAGWFRNRTANPHKPGPRFYLGA
jgi:hypothetical protein